MAPESIDEGSPTLIAWRLGQIEATLAGLVEKVVSRDRYEVEVGHLKQEMKDLNERQDEVENTRVTGNRWAVATVISILAALIAAAATIVAVLSLMKG